MKELIAICQQYDISANSREFLQSRAIFDKEILKKHFPASDLKKASTSTLARSREFLRQ